MSQFVRLVGAQVAGDVRGLPGAVRSRLSESGRVERCVSIADIRRLARRRVPRAVFDFVDGGAWDEVTARRNQEDFAKLSIESHVLVDVSAVDTSTTLLGARISTPIVGAPTGLTGLSHHRGELAVAGALHDAGTAYTLSSSSSYALEDVAAAAAGRLWFQVYVLRDRELVRDMVERARAAGYEALVLTVDVSSAGPRERDIRNRFSIPPRITLSSCLAAVTRPRWSAAFVTRPRTSMSNVARYTDGAGPVALAKFINAQYDPSVTWEDLAWFRDLWQGPLLIKGILRPDDARTAVGLGADGIVVSNHGGRQLDHAVSSIRALPAIVDAVGSETELILDGGIRRGTDILKAVALGARACMVGRPLIYGLAAGGEAGVRQAVGILSNELRVAMALAGCPTLGSVDDSLLSAPLFGAGVR